MEIKTPEQLITLLEQVPLKGKQRFELNRVLANHTRKEFRSQIRVQRDVNDKAYAPRNRLSKAFSILKKQQAWGDKKNRKRRRKKGSSKERVEHNLYLTEALSRVNVNDNMLKGLSKDLKTRISSENFEVGLTGLSGRIARKHNDGSKVSFTTRVNGFFNSSTGKWEGGRAVKNYYKMPQRTHIGWSKKLQRELTQIIFKHMQPKG